MRIIPLVIFTTLTVGLVFILNTKTVIPAPLGKLLSPQHGIWQNADNRNKDFSLNLQNDQLKGQVDVYLDDRLVPHVFASNGQDVYFVQGYLHAKFRLWQMELQTHAAAGRVSEIIGSKGLHHDREFRRLGMGYAAEQSLKEMESDAQTKSTLDAYTAGVNAYINSLKASQLPIEYKLIGYQPELWTNLKTALFLKYMSYDLAGHDNDFEMTNAHQYFNKEDFALLYPNTQDSLDPIIPKGAGYPEAKVKPIAPVIADSAYFDNKSELATFQHNNPDKDNGSNNWAVAGSKTKTGAPILCNDPHLGLNLPSLWFEMQLSTPEYNAYGATFPGAPGVIIGYNDSCAFGFTNGGRDVKDYYAIQFKDASKKEYLFNGNWLQTDLRVEQIKIKDSLTFVDTVAYTVFGPVMYEPSFSANDQTRKKYYALRWTAHDPGNEIKMFLLLDKAKNYADYTEAAQYLKTPGQNCIFACKDGDIALRTQGNWPAKWKGQGDFVMPGSDSSFMWQGMIPMDETPLQHNPERGFVSSANQHPTDSTYPYYLGRNYPIYRGIIVNRLLTDSNLFTPDDMMKMQTNNYNVFAETAMRPFLKYLQPNLANKDEAYFYDILKSWDLYNNPDSKGATVFKIFWDEFYAKVYDDEFKKAPQPIMKPFESTLVEAILRDSSYKFIDNVETPEVENITTILHQAFVAAISKLELISTDGKLTWAKYKATRVNHLAKLEPFSRTNLNIGGGTHVINAAKEAHGPSWRMVVSLTKDTEAFGIYPGGQNGNPGSKYYDNFVNDWVAGNHYTLWLMKKEEQNDKRIKWKMTFKSTKS